MEKLVIDRQTWLRGEGGENSFLFRSLDGKMCCLGFLARAAGLTEAAIVDVRTPAELENPQGSVLRLLQPVADAKEELTETDLCNSMMATNDALRMEDDSGSSDTAREMQLKKQFRDIDIDVTFVN